MSEPSDVDALFKLPLGEFTSARNALSAQLKKAGHKQEADDAKALTKPSVSAWAVNQLYWRHRKTFDRLLDAGERLRRAQLTGASTREPMDARRAAVAELSGIAEALLRADEYGATRDILRRVTTTLEALASYHSLPNAPAAGRLIDDVEPPGFDAVAGLLGAPTATKPAPRTEQAIVAKKRDDEDTKHQHLFASVKAAVHEAERALSAARKRADRAAAESAAAAARAKALEADRAQLERKLDLATRAAAEADERARKAAAGASEAAAAADGAEWTLELARREVQPLTRG